MNEGKTLAYSMNGKAAAKRLKHLLRDVPEEEKEEAALRFIRYLEVVIDISEA